MTIMMLTTMDTKAIVRMIGKLRLSVFSAFSVSESKEISGVFHNLSNKIITLPMRRLVSLYIERQPSLVSRRENVKNN